MTRRAASTKRHGVAVEPSPTLIDGVPHTSVTVAKSVPFARACVDLLHDRDGRDHSWKLRAKAFWAPDEVIAAARTRVEADARRRDAGGAA